MDATKPAARLISEMYGVAGYPTVMIFKDTQPFLYRGKRTVSGIVNFMRFWKPNDQGVFCGQSLLLSFSPALREDSWFYAIQK
jgi:hypothetical protein